MFEKEIDSVKKSQSIVVYALSFGIVCLVVVVVGTYLNELSVDKKRDVACIPVGSDYALPMVQSQNFYNPAYEDAKIKSFVENYVHKLKDESVTNYFDVGAENRNDLDAVSRHKLELLEMSLGDELERNQEAFKHSSERQRWLKEKGVGWMFNIARMEIYPAPGTGVVAIVYGDYQTTFDRTRVDVPAEILGYKVIRLLIIQGQPKTEAAGKYTNKTGLYVISSVQDDLSPDQYKLVTSLSNDTYMGP